MVNELGRIVLGEIRREFKRAQAYWLEILADQVFFALGFLLFVGLLQIIAEGNYDAGARLASLVGFVIWRVADGCILRTVDSISEDAESGTLEQVWLSAVSPQFVLFARSIAVLLYHTARGLLLAAILIPLLGVSLTLTPVIIVLFLLTQLGAFGVAFIAAGLHLVYKNISSIMMAISTALLFLTGSLAPLEQSSQLYLVSRLLPLTIGIELTRQVVDGSLPWHMLWQQPDFYKLVFNTMVYGLLGWFVMEWGQRTARQQGSLSHY